MADSSPASSANVDAFIERWSASGASEIANANLFLSELCTLLGVDGPDPAGPDTRQNDYVFERRVTFRPDQEGERGRIDLYKKGCFVLEAKQGSDAPQPSEAETLDLHAPTRRSPSSRSPATSTAPAGPTSRACSTRSPPSATSSTPMPAPTLGEPHRYPGCVQLPRQFPRTTLAPRHLERSNAKPRDPPR